MNRPSLVFVLALGSLGLSSCKQRATEADTKEVGLMNTRTNTTLVACLREGRVYVNECKPETDFSTAICSSPECSKQLLDGGVDEAVFWQAASAFPTGNYTKDAAGAKAMARAIGLDGSDPELLTWQANLKKYLDLQSKIKAWGVGDGDTFGQNSDEYDMIMSTVANINRANAAKAADATARAAAQQAADAASRQRDLQRRREVCEESFANCKANNFHGCDLVRQECLDQIPPT